jgi:hypothetical protein
MLGANRQSLVLCKPEWFFRIILVYCCLEERQYIVKYDRRYREGRLVA